MLAANLVGASAVRPGVAARTSIFAPTYARNVGGPRTRSDGAAFGTVLLRGILAGWLIALMVWLLPFAETARVWVIVIITYVVGIGHFSHVIAGSVDTIFVVAAGQRPGWEYVARFLLPALAGNVIGGVSLVAAIAHAQFVAGEEMPQRPIAVRQLLADAKDVALGGEGVAPLANQIPIGRPTGRMWRSRSQRPRALTRPLFSRSPVSQST